MKTDPTASRLKYFPVTSFSIIMGLSGLTIALSKFYHLQWFPRWPYWALLALTSVLFIFFFTLYLLKGVVYPEEVRADYRHKIRMNFMPTISISFLLLSIAYLALWPFLSAPLWLIGTILQTLFSFHIISTWIMHEFKIDHFNPAWFIPVVGNILVPIAGVEFAPLPVSAFYFSAGLFFWIVLSTIILYRLIFHQTMPQKLMPTLFIFMAPPAIGFISYMRLTMSYDFISQSLLFLGFFIFVLLGFLHRIYRKTPFFLSWWAYTFPLAAITIASIVAFQITKFSTYKYFAWLGMTLLIGIIGTVAFFTVKNVKNRTICVEEN